MASRPIGKDAPPIDVVIVTYRSEDHIGACLTTLGASEGVSLGRVVVVDNSPDGASIAAAQRAMPEARVLRSKGNVGFAAAVNRGLAVMGPHPKPALVLLLNPDTRLEPETLRRCAEAMLTDDRIGMTGPLLVTASGTVDHACRRGSPTAGASLAYLTRLHRIWPERPWATAYLGGPESSRYRSGPCEAINGAFMLCRWSAVDEVGPLDTRYWMYGEDLDWCDRFRAAGYIISFVADASAVHLKGASAGTVRERRTNWWFHRAMLIYMWDRVDRWTSRSLAAAATVAILVRFGVLELRRNLAGRTRPFVVRRARGHRHPLSGPMEAR